MVRRWFCRSVIVHWASHRAHGYSHPPFFFRFSRLANMGLHQHPVICAGLELIQSVAQVVSNLIFNSRGIYLLLLVLRLARTLQVLRCIALIRLNLIERRPLRGGNPVPANLLGSVVKSVAGASRRREQSSPSTRTKTCCRGR